MSLFRAHLSFLSCAILVSRQRSLCSHRETPVLPLTVHTALDLSGSLTLWQWRVQHSKSGVLLFVCLILWCFFSKLPTRQAICHILQSASSFLGLLLPIKGYVGEGGGEANALYRASPIGRPVSPLSIVLYPYIVHGSTN